MSKEHFSLLVKTLELEEKLANENFTNFSLDNIEKDNKNKMWTFNFSGKSLPSSEEFALFIQKLRESFQGEYLVKYCLNIEKKVSIEEIKEYWKFVILENFSELAPVLLESILFSKIDVKDNILSLNIMAPSIWNNFINEKKSQILGSYANLGITLKDIRPIFSKTDVDAVLENQEEKINKEITKLEEAEKEIKKNIKEIEKILNRFPASNILACWGNLIEKRMYFKYCLKGLKIDNDIVNYTFLDKIKDIKGIISLTKNRKWFYRGIITKKGHPNHQVRTKNSARLEEFNIKKYIKEL